MINRFIHPDGSMASIYGMQSAMNLDGKWKVLGAFFLGAIAKIFRKPGVFYAIARAASLTDDVTGTMPPFDKHIVFGPKIQIRWLKNRSTHRLLWRCCSRRKRLETLCNSRYKSRY